MKKIIVIVFSAFTFWGCASSINIPSPSKEPSEISRDERKKIKEAMELHDQGKYEKAISIYHDILKEHPDNVYALYEASYSLFMTRNYEQGLEYALRGLEYKSEYTVDLLTLAGNHLDELGRPGDAAEVYKKGIAQSPDYYLLHYNLALAYLNMNKSEEAEKSLYTALECNHKHPSSHLALGKSFKKEGKQIPSLLNFLRFLILEPNSSRSKDVIGYIDEVMNWGVEKKGNKKIDINIFNPGSESPYSVLELTLRLKKAYGYSEENKNKSAFQLKKEELESLISVMEEQKQTDYSDLTVDYLFPYFVKLKKSENVEAFIYFIHQADGDEEINDWLDKNQDKVDNFLKWDRNYSWEKD